MRLSVARGCSPVVQDLHRIRVAVSDGGRVAVKHLSKEEGHLCDDAVSLQ